MRVIGGEFRSRRLRTPPGLGTRPTPDRLRESLFNILTPRIENTVFADLYAGSGSVGIEALSRGARQAIFVERSRGCLDLIRSNLADLALTSRALVLAGAAASRLEGIEADIHFVDPPYERAEEYERVLDALGRRGRGLVVVQHASRAKLAQRYGSLALTRQVRQGDNTLSFYEPVA